MNLDKIPRDKVGFGSTVHLKDGASGAITIYQLVMPEDADVEQGLISTASPIGRAMLNKEEGDEVTVTTPAGSRQFELVKLSTIHDEHGRRAPPSVITPDSPDRLYSTRLRTAVVLTGSGTAGAYHAGVLRALHEAGVRMDLVAGRGMGAVSAMFAAVDGGPRLWEPSGIWKGGAARRFYRWRAALRVAAGAARWRPARFCCSRCCCSRSPSWSAWPASC